VVVLPPISMFTGVAPVNRAVSHAKLTTPASRSTGPAEAEI